MGFWNAFKIAGDNNGLLHGAVTWLLPYFIKTLAAAALTARFPVKLKSSKYSVKEGVLTVYCQVVNHL